MKAKHVVLLLLLPAAGGAWLLGRNGSDGASAGARWGRVDRGDLWVLLEADGTVQPVYEVEVRSKASGQILRFDAAEGDFVEAGTTLVLLERQTEERNLERARAEDERGQAALARVTAETDRAVAQAESTLTVAREEIETRRRDLERFQGMGPDQVSESQIDQATLALRQAEDRLRQAEQAATYAAQSRESQVLEARAARRIAEVALHDAEDRLADTEIRAPIRGVLLKKLLDQGEFVSSSLSAASGGTPVAVIGDLSSLIVEAMVDETDIGHVTVGQAARVDIPAVPGRSFTGVVTHIAPRAEETDQIPRIKVKVRLSGSEFDRSFVYIRANVKFILDHREGIVRVPSEALLYERDRVYVRTRTGEATVRLGADTGEYAEVLEGLSDGDEVMLAPPPEEETPGRRPLR